jgi:hypothetical protein
MGSGASHKCPRTGESLNYTNTSKRVKGLKKKKPCHREVLVDGAPTEPLAISIMPVRTFLTFDFGIPKSHPDL